MIDDDIIKDLFNISPEQLEKIYYEKYKNKSLIELYIIKQVSLYSPEVNRNTCFIKNSERWYSIGKAVDKLLAEKII